MMDHGEVMKTMRSCPGFTKQGRSRGKGISITSTSGVTISIEYALTQRDPRTEKYKQGALLIKWGESNQRKLLFSTISELERHLAWAGSLTSSKQLPLL